MIQKLLDYYKKEMNPSKLVFYQFRWLWWLLIFIGILNVLVGFIIFIMKKPDYILIPFILAFMVVFIVLNNKAKKEVLKKYCIKPTGLLWGGLEYYEMLLEMLKTYLERNNLYTDKKIRLLIELLYKRAEKTRPTGLLGLGVFLALFIPVWSNFTGWLYENYSNTFQDSFSLILLVSMLLAMTIAILRMTQTMLIDIFDRERETMKDLASKLEDLLLFIE